MTAHLPPDAPVVCEVHIDLPARHTGTMNNQLCEARIRCGEKVLWQGFSGTTAIFPAEREMTVEITLLAVYTGRPFAFFKDITLRATVTPGGHYAAVPCRRTGLSLKLRTKEA